MSTTFPSGLNLEKDRKWYLVDATDQVVGRLASRVARILTGKNNPRYAPFLDMGDHVIIVNGERVALTGKKLDAKLYRHHTLYPGGLKQSRARDLLAKHPERILEYAIKGMLPKTTLGRSMAKKLKVYAGPNHPHAAQKPVALVMQK